MAQIQTTSLYVGDLDLNVTESQLYDLFNQVGEVVSVRVCRDLSSHRSLGYGYVNYRNPRDAARAMEVLNFTPLNTKVIRVQVYSHSRRGPSNRKFSAAANIFIKNLDKTIDSKALHDTFSSFGSIFSCKIATDHSSGQSKGYGFVQFDSEEAARSAIDKLNGMLINDKQVYVGPFLPKQERDSKSTLGNNKFNNIYVKNIVDSTSDDDLKTIFGEYGTITSAVVMKDADGKSKCFGFVNFEHADDAAKAVEALNGKKFEDKEWYVGKAQKKSEREKELKGRFEQTTRHKFPLHAQFLQMRPPRIGQQLYYGQAPAVIPPQAGFGYQQQLVPGMPNLFMPVVQQNQQAVPMIMLPRGRILYRNPPGRNAVPLPGVGGGMLSVPYHMGGMVPRDAALVSALENATPEQQRRMLGEKLYPLVDQLEHEHAAKVTGMLLEMDLTEVLHLLESPHALKAKVVEVMHVLRNVNAQDQFV